MKVKEKQVKIETDVLEVLKQGKVDGNSYHLPGQLTRDMYVRVNKILELLSFKWDRRLKLHITQDGLAAYRLKEALDGLTQTVVDEKATYQFFETPLKLAGRMVALSGMKPGDRVLEPSAGRGAIIDAIWALPKKDVPSVLFAIELNPKHVQYLKGVDAERNQDSGWGRTLCVEEGDFLEHTEKYDRILMNPPFNGGRDIAHVRHAYDLLLPGGVLVAITSPSWEFNSQKKFVEFKSWYNSLYHRGLASIPERLDEGTFKESGTNVSALLLLMQKPLAK